MAARITVGCQMAERRGKTLIITGASLGIGRALVLELAYMGVNFVLNARTPAPLDEAAAAAQKKIYAPHQVCS